MNVEGTILRGRGFEPVEGRVVCEDGEIVAIEEEAVETEHIVVPAFVNAHTHVGDSIAKEAGAGLTLEELVAPPDGLKHRLLRSASNEQLEAAMTRTLRYMERTGTGTFIDFREGGVPGVESLRSAAADLAIEAIAMGRDDPQVIEIADGYGASGAADGEFGRERSATAAAGKPFGIHAGEVDPGDINPALDLDPDFLVHMVHARNVHLERVADSGTPVVVCPRSNLTTGVGTPPVEALLEHTTVALGTDNVMIHGPSMFREMAVLDAITDVPPPTIFGMATWAGGELLGTGVGELAPGHPAKLLVLDGDSDNLAGAQDYVQAIVRRADPSDVASVHLCPT